MAHLKGLLKMQMYQPWILGLLWLWGTRTSQEIKMQESKDYPEKNQFRGFGGGVY